MHHIISDGDVSAENFLKQVLAELSGEVCADVVLDHSYTTLTQAKKDIQGLAFWRDYLDDVPQHINLPRDLKPKSSDRSACPVVLSKELVTQLNKLANSCYCSLTDVLMSAYGLLLKAHTAQDAMLIAWLIQSEKRITKVLAILDNHCPSVFSRRCSKFP